MGISHDYKIDGRQLTETEKWILEQLSEGLCADLDKYAKNPEHRILRASFLEGLLTAGIENLIIHRLGIRIINAIIDEPVNLESAIISYFVSLTYCSFNERVNLVNAHFEKNLSVEGSIFLKEANFHNIKVDMSFFIRHAIFEQSVSFSHASIGRSLEAKGTCFNGRENDANFNSMKVGKSIDFIFSKFNAPVNLVYITASNMFLTGTEEEPLKIKKLALENASFEKELVIGFVEVNILNMKYMQIKGRLLLNNVMITDKVDLSYAILHNLKINKVQFPIANDSVFLDGLIYRSITAGEEKDDWKKLIELVEISKFNFQNYARLETFFNECGQQERADEVYIRGKRRELSKQKWWHLKRWATWLLWDKLTNYGRKPGRTIWVSFIIIIIGAFFLNPSLLKPDILSRCSWLSQTNFYQNTIIRMILSLNQFLPAIDLGLTKELQLSNMNCYTFIYLQIHKICGWILIPIGLAAIYSKTTGKIWISRYQAAFFHLFISSAMEC